VAGKLCAIKDGCHDLGTTHLKDPGKSVPGGGICGKRAGRNRA